MKNLARVAGMLLTATTTSAGDPFDDLEELYGRVLGQWSLEMNHVAAIVGGFNSQQKAIGQQGLIFSPISRQKQAGAVRFLNDNAFQVPKWATDTQILRRIEPAGVLDRVKTSQQRVLGSLLSSARITRLVEQETLDGAAAYKPTEFLAEVRQGIWSEMYGTGPARVDAFRRNLQRAYIETLTTRINGPQAAADDARAFFRGELKTLDNDLRLASARATDRATRLHIDDARMMIARALDPSAPAAAAAAGAAQRPGTLDDPLDVSVSPDSCWPDYTIRRSGGGQ
jgi:hypothetical protein